MVRTYLSGQRKAESVMKYSGVVRIDHGDPAVDTNKAKSTIANRKLCVV